jgi:hypothetical protein
MHKRTAHSLAGDVDRSLKLSLSNREFEVLASYIESSDDWDKTAKSIMAGSVSAAWFLIKNHPTQF